LDDSKKLRPKVREELFITLTTHPEICWAVGEASVEEIGDLNILRATALAMRRALLALNTKPAHALVDGLPVKNLPVPQTALVGGDGLSLSIAAASVIAKVTRDRMMDELDRAFPHYGFARHRGYGTQEHLKQLRQHGPCQHHRRGFKPVDQASFKL
jgi:ribonuclease HII